jgi:hypothetical protein
MTSNDFQQVVDYYANFYPEYSRNSIEDVIRTILNDSGKLDAINVEYHLKPKEVGGLGYGVAVASLSGSNLLFG